MPHRATLRTRVVITALLLNGGASACTERPPDDRPEVERVVLGDTTVVRTLAGQTWGTEVSLTDEVVIGALDGPPEVTFGQISRLAEDPEGGIYILDAQAIEVRHFDRSGAFVRTVGRAGQGPGEYQRLSLGMVVDGDGVLYLHDWGNGRIVRYGPDGDPLPEWSPTSTFLTTVPGRWLYSEAPGRVLVADQIDGAPALLVMEDGEIVRTLTVPRLPGVPAERGGPYLVDTYWGRSPEGCFVVGVSDRYALDVRCDAGVVRIERDVPAVPVNPEEAAAWRARFEWMEREPAYRAPEGEWLPTVMPPFRAIEVGTDGRIWVRRNVDPVPVATPVSSDGPPPVGWAQPFAYDVFEANGTFLGELRFPDRFEPRLFGAGYVWGVRRGTFDEQYLVRMAITGAG